ncbi:MAG: type I-E CRISPR-associated protein Cse1/CasA [Armatimonadetes bacterium]|nr:type I-E CRISPR-associated protein Cse1/CasA [Armatimonadota bacterium]
MSSFCLNTEPWIPVELVNGTHKLVSLRESFQGAKSIRKTVGNPLEVAVLLRLLLAIVQRVHTPKSDDELCAIDLDHLMANCLGYVDEHQDKFDLYDKSRPFLQHPSLETTNGTAAKVIYEMNTGNNPVFLDHCIDARPVVLSSAQAARGLLVLHAYGGSGTGSLNPLNQGKKDTMYAGPLCARMPVTLDAGRLDWTLLLNLWKDRDSGIPAWEQGPPKPASLTPFTGVCDLYTRQTRLVKLDPNEDGSLCVGASVFMGEGLPPETDGSRDPMMAQYYASDKKWKVTRLATDRAVWRSAHALLANRDGQNKDRYQRIRAIDNALFMHQSAGITPPFGVALRILGVSANAQGPVTEMWREEVLPFSFSVIENSTAFWELETRIQAAEDQANKLRYQLRKFARSYLEETVAEPKPEDVEALVNKIAPGLHTFWHQVGSRGESLAMEPCDAGEWQSLLIESSRNNFREAVNALPASAARYRAEFATKFQPHPKKEKAKP